MNLTIKATHTTLTESIKNVITEKLATLETFLKSQHKLHVEVQVDKKHKSGQIFRVECTVKPDGFYAEATGMDAYEALDLLVPKIKEQLAKEKDKKISLRRKLGNKVKRGVI